MRDGRRSDCIPCNLAAKKARTALSPQANRDRVFRCNNALGDFREEYELFRKAADYLDRDDELAGLVQARAGALGR